MKEIAVVTWENAGSDLNILRKPQLEINSVTIFIAPTSSVQDKSRTKMHRQLYQVSSLVLCIARRRLTNS